MDNHEIRYLGDVQKLELKPNDVLVITLDERHISEAMAENLRKDLLRIFPDHKNKILVLQARTKIGVLEQ